MNKKSYGVLLVIVTIIITACVGIAQNSTPTSSDYDRIAIAMHLRHMEHTNLLTAYMLRPWTEASARFEARSQAFAEAAAYVEQYNGVNLEASTD